MVINENTSKFAFLICKTEEKISFFPNNPIISLVIIGIISIAMRLLFFDPELPIRQDANSYFWYAIDMSILKSLPNSPHANDGWPMVLSTVFSIFNFNNYLDYTIIQRLTTIVISVLTIIPVYYLSRRFFSPSYSILGVAIFAFEPHLIQNSLLGLTEPLYIFLGISALSLFLSQNKKFVYFSFGLIAFTTLIRAEGIVFFVIMALLFFIFNKKNKKLIGEFLIIIIIFSAVFGLMTIIKTSSSELDDTAAVTIGRWVTTSVTTQEGGITLDNAFKGIETLTKRLAQSMVPYFALFVPFGLILVFRNMNKNKLLIITSLIIYLVVSIRMLSIVSDIRLLFILYPLFGILSVYTIQHLTQKFEFKKIFLVLIMGACLVLSMYFLYSNDNSKYQNEVNYFANYIINNVKVSNNFYPESGLVYGVWASSELIFPITSSDAKYLGPQLLDYVKDSNFEYLSKNANSVEEYIQLARNQNLSRLVIDSNENREQYFKDIFYNEEKYSYLIKKFDSLEEGFTHYNVKVFKIDYDKFDMLFKEN